MRLGDHFQLECAWFVFSDFLQAELDKMKEEWNTHRIRRWSYAKVAGIPDEMYCGYKNCGIVISTKKINHILDDKDVHYEAHCLLNTCDKRLKQYFTHIIELVGTIMPPNDWVEARKIYDLIVSSSSRISLLK